MCRVRSAVSLLTENFRGDMWPPLLPPPVKLSYLFVRPKWCPCGAVVRASAEQSGQRPTVNPTSAYGSVAHNLTCFSSPIHCLKIT